MTRKISIPVGVLGVLSCLYGIGARAAKKAIPPAKLVRMRATAAAIGKGPASSVLPDNRFFAWVDKEESEYRVLAAFAVGSDALGVPADRVIQAELLFTLTPWELGRPGVRVEQFVRTLPLNGGDMYAAADKVLLRDAWISGTHRLDVTDAVKQVMAGPAPIKSLVIRWSQDNDADAGPRHDTAPYVPGTANPVRVNTGSTVEEPRLVVRYLPTVPEQVRITAQRLPGSAALVCQPATEVRDHGDVERTGSLARLVCAAGLKPTRILLLKGLYPVHSNLTIPRATVLEFEPGAILEIAETATVTIDGFIDAGPWQVFALQGTLGGGARNDTVLPVWFGAAGDGRADDTGPLQQAADFACRSGILNLSLGRGRYRITKTLNLTNTRLPNTLHRDGLCVRGSSFTNTEIIGDTGDGHAIIETSGVQWLKLDNFRIRAGKRNPSTVGIFTGCPKVLPQSNNHVYHVYISLHDDPAANAGKGTIGLWNFASEEHTYSAIYIHANRPVVLTAFNNWKNKSGPGFYFYRHSYVELLEIHSLGVTTFSGECFLFCVGGRFPAMTTQCANSLAISNTYIGSAGGGANLAGTWEADAKAGTRNGTGAVCAFDIYGSLVNLNYSGTIEGKAAFARINGELKASRVSATFGGVTAPGAPVLILGTNGQILNSDLRFQLEACLDRPLLTGGGKSAALINCSIKSNHADRWLDALPESVIRHSRNSRIATPGRVLDVSGK